jgi:hypothetical protein
VARWVRPDGDVPGAEDAGEWARRRLAQARVEQRRQLEGQRRRLLEHVRRRGGDLDGFGTLLAHVEAELAALPALPDDVGGPAEAVPWPPAGVVPLRPRQGG